MIVPDINLLLVADAQLAALALERGAVLHTADADFCGSAGRAGSISLAASPAAVYPEATVLSPGKALLDQRVAVADAARLDP
jgi:hypothetical protein